MEKILLRRWMHMDKWIKRRNFCSGTNCAHPVQFNVDAMRRGRDGDSPRGLYREVISHELQFYDFSPRTLPSGSEKLKFLITSDNPPANCATSSASLSTNHRRKVPFGTSSFHWVTLQRGAFAHEWVSHRPWMPLHLYEWCDLLMELFSPLEIIIILVFIISCSSHCLTSFENITALFYARSLRDYGRVSGESWPSEVEPSRHGRGWCHIGC